MDCVGCRIDVIIVELYSNWKRSSALSAPSLDLQILLNMNPEFITYFCCYYRIESISTHPDTEHELWVYPNKM
jgi:hypothetical protein